MQWETADALKIKLTNYGVSHELYFLIFYHVSYTLERYQNIFGGVPRWLMLWACRRQSSPIQTLKSLPEYLIWAKSAPFPPTCYKQTDRCAPRRKRNDNTALAIFVHMVPTVNHQLEREIWELRCFFSSIPSRLTMPLKTSQGKQEKKRQQCYCCYIGRYHDKPKH